MSSPTPSDRVPSLNDILARLAELAPATDRVAAAKAPEPDVAPAASKPMLDLDAAETEAVAAADRAAAPAVVADVESVSTDVRGPAEGHVATTAEPVIDLRDRPPATEPDRSSLDVVAPSEREDAALDVTEPSEATLSVEAATADGTGADRFEIRPAKPDDGHGSTPDGAPQQRRSHNPFRRLIIWSVVLGATLILVAGVMLIV